MHKNLSDKEIENLVNASLWRFKADSYRNQIEDLKNKIEVLTGYANSAEFQANLYIDDALKNKIAELPK